LKERPFSAEAIAALTADDRRGTNMVEMVPVEVRVGCVGAASGQTFTHGYVGSLNLVGYGSTLSSMEWQRGGKDRLAPQFGQDK
jgi:hypothetical protein